MDDKDFKVAINSIDTLLAKIASSPSQTQLDLDYDYSVTTQAATISQAASASTWPYPYVSTNTGTYTLTNTNGTGGTLGLDWNIAPQKQVLHVQGDAEFEGDVKIKGKSLTDMLDKIEERLAILHPNEKLEEKWLELKKLGDMYRALEKDILEKEKIWETLKK